jgi:hypothetical protein
MDQNKALEILINVAVAAQAKGVLSLDDAVVVKQAIEVFIPKKEVEVEDVKSEE